MIVSSYKIKNELHPAFNVIKKISQFQRERVGHKKELVNQAKLISSRATTKFYSSVPCISDDELRDLDA